MKPVRLRASDDTYLRLALIVDRCSAELQVQGRLLVHGGSMRENCTKTVLRGRLCHRGLCLPSRSGTRGQPALILRLSLKIIYGKGVSGGSTREPLGSDYEMAIVEVAESASCRAWGA